MMVSIRQRIGLGLLAVGLIASAICSVCFGATDISWGTVSRVLFSFLPSIDVPPDVGVTQIILDVRLPRVILGVLVGVALGVAGAAFQGILRNPLADPFTLGVSSGASLGAALVLLFHVHVSWLGLWTLPLGAFACAMATLLFIFLLTQRDHGFQTPTLVLAGIVVQAFLAAAVSFLIFLQGQSANTIVFWIMGKLTMRGWDFVVLIAPYVVVITLFIFAFGRTLNMFALGERHAFHAGIRIVRARWAVLLAATAVTAVAVAVTGVIGFVGLVVPHLVRLVVGSDYRLVLPASALVGGIYVVWADTLARTLFAPTELPLGVVTAALGAPFFLYLLYRPQSSCA